MAAAGEGTACHAIGRVLMVFATSDWPDTRCQGGILLPLYYDYVSQRGARPLVAVSLFRPVRATRDGRPRITRPHSRAARGKSHFAYPLVSVDRWIFSRLEETPFQPPTFVHKHTHTPGLWTRQNGLRPVMVHVLFNRSSSSNSKSGIFGKIYKKSTTHVCISLSLSGCVYRITFAI